MKVTLGRIVHYNAGTGIRPAIVVNVLSSGKVNLQVFMDGKELLWASSIEEATDEFLPGTWRWPPRES